MTDPSPPAEAAPEPPQADAQAQADAQPRAGRRRRPLSRKKKLVFASGLLIVLVGVAELVTRVADAARGANFASHDPARSMYRADPFMQVALRPGAELIDPEQTFKINGLGFRGPEFEGPKPEGTLRVICVGASTTFGHSAPSDATTWPRLLEGQLREALPGKTIQVINAGVPGYTTFHNLPNLGLRLLPLEPDVVVFYQGVNDLAQQGKLTRDPTGYRIVRPKRTRHGFLTRAKESSLLYLVLRNQIQAWRREHVPEPEGLGSEIGPAAPRAYERNLRGMITLTKEAGAVPVLVTFGSRYVPQPTPEQERAAWVDMHLAGLNYAGLVAGHKRYNDIVRELAKRYRAPLAEGEVLSGKQELFSDSVHLTEPGRRALAEAVFPVVKAALER
jgi:lysophospholipase L1-like esterase